MSRPDSQWFLPISWPGWGEQERLTQSKPITPTQVSDHDQTDRVLLVDTCGKPLLVRRSRPIGFQDPTKR